MVNVKSRKAMKSGLRCSAIFLLLSCATNLFAQCPSTVIERNRSSVVSIHVQKTIKPTGAVTEVYGSGFIVSPSGYLLTNSHVIERDQSVAEISIEGSIGSGRARPIPLEVVAKNTDADIALLRFQNTAEKYTPVALGDPSEVTFQTNLCSIGFPLNVAFLSVSGTLGSRSAPGGNWHTQMPSNRGESGAPVFNEMGETIAIKVGSYEGAQNLNVLIPINLARDLLGRVPDIRQFSPCTPDVFVGYFPIGRTTNTHPLKVAERSGVTIRAAVEGAE